MNDAFCVVTRHSTLSTNKQNIKARHAKDEAPAMTSSLACDREGSYHCLDLFSAPRKVLKIEDGEERERALLDLVVSRGSPFPQNSLKSQSPLTFVEEFVVCVSLLITMGGPLLWFVVVPLCMLLFTPWSLGFSLSIWVVGTVFLAQHPLPKWERWWPRSHTVRSMYKYFSYRICWKGDARIRARSSAPFVGAGGPHGVLPFANL